MKDPNEEKETCPNCGLGTLDKHGRCDNCPYCESCEG